ncbi:MULTISPECIES: AraC family transcriptional regulator [Bacillus]|uniref:DUF6944 family repetitive protein n=1 Tax=Bacillus TaxID=1386 RepID=UPI000DC4C11C|nr:MULTISPECIES: AraC family transcriptional regulator [Bacillus]RAN80194.1 AraC family transcriptional regulator [Bacillus sp. SRB_331]TBX55386.1 AraC family transcriptional regulator [Bacillus mycoides]
MNLRDLELTGAWFQVGGNLIAAIGTTRGFAGEGKIESDLVIVGSSLQALGYILQIIATNDAKDEDKCEKQEVTIDNKNKALAKTGIELLALGNISNVIGTYFNLNEQMKENDFLIITGNSLQSIGAFLGVEVALNEINGIQWIIVLGNSMQSLGAGLQAYEGIKNIPKEEKGKEDSNIDKEDQRIIGLIGIWIQAIGTVISAIGLTEIVEEQRLESKKR